ncbi:TrkH family potassium uptake protein [Deinococcus maricopensis]|uniref:Potassium uptake protein, TrkH family n=1 Tax=Deinococcus maricopensis (strain DSM 21211 / LMG 22137 / NRRL B-23946 / LB-34) TaxID=709986 RepID=E8UBJ2_DEIML|nr:TrkH family potassium uptake protein [Deinococcus maricopensis]ADV68431.1 potassium uptake protein, TrkH family [Deinococcus maricopensis DSM 21211]
MARRPPLRLTAPQLVAATFALGILIGALLLSLPFAHTPGHALTPLQAAFMATSALSVTGLAVVDPGTSLSPFGQVVLLLLVQIGGLGIITFGTLLALLAGRRLYFTDRVRLAQHFSALDVGGVLPLIRRILLTTLAIELLGTLLLWARFAPEQGAGRGLYSAAFHAINAFNNAGFALYPDNLARYATDPFVTLVLSALIILGGLGFLVQLSVVAHLRNPREHRLGVHVKIALSVTAALLLVGIAGFALTEWTNPRTLGPLSPLGKLTASVFQGVTPRTSGLHTLPYDAMRPATLLLTTLLMFIGANPGSTGGGIKTTTFYVVLRGVWNYARGRGEPVTHHRRLDRDLITRAMTIALLGIGVLHAALLLLLLTNPSVPPMNALFETVSALSTAGLSMNTTPHLNAAGHLLLIVLMYLGRVGPLMLATSLSARASRDTVRYPPERDILLG